MANNFLTKKPLKPRVLKPKEEVIETKNEDITINDEIEEVIEPIDPEVHATIEDPIDVDVEENPKNPAEEIETPEEKIEEETILEKSEETEEEKPKKKKKSRSKKQKENKKELEEELPKEPLASIDKTEEIVAELINPYPEYWETEKAEVEGVLSELIITEELDPTTLKALIAKMSAAYNDLMFKSSEAKSDYENLKDSIDIIKSQNSIGSSADERKANGLKAVSYYKKDEESEPVDLMAYLKFKRMRKDFYENALKTLDLNRQLLITFSSAFKLELNAY